MIPWLLYGGIYWRRQHETSQHLAPEDKAERRLRTERILFGEGDKLLDVGRQYT